MPWHSRAAPYRRRAMITRKAQVPFPKGRGRAEGIKGWVSKERTPSSTPVARERSARRDVASLAQRMTFTAKRKSRNRSSSLSLASPASTPSVRALKTLLNPTRAHSGTPDQLGNTWQVWEGTQILMRKRNKNLAGPPTLLQESSPPRSCSGLAGHAGREVDDLAAQLFGGPLFAGQRKIYRNVKLN